MRCSRVQSPPQLHGGVDMRYIALLEPELALAACGGSSTTTLHGTFTDSAYSRLTSETYADQENFSVTVSVDNVAAGRRVA